MPPTLPQTARLLTYSHGRRGPDARPISLVLASTGRASETRDEAVASVEDILRREPDFAEPGEMERRQREEAWPSGRAVAVTTGLVVLLIALVATATVQIMRVLA